MLESDPPYLSPKSMEHSTTCSITSKLKKTCLFHSFNQLTSSNTNTRVSVLQQQPHPQNAAKSTLFKQPTIESRNCIPFNGANTPFSNFFPCNVTYQTQSFHNTEQIYQWVKSIDTVNHYIASEIWKLTNGYAIKNVVMCYLYLQLNNGEPGEVSL